MAEWKPRARWVSRRMRELTDSTRALGEVVNEGVEDRLEVPVDDRDEPFERPQLGGLRSSQPRLEEVEGGVEGELEDEAECPLSR